MIDNILWAIHGFK